MGSGIEEEVISFSKGFFAADDHRTLFAVHVRPAMASRHIMM